MSPSWQPAGSYDVGVTTTPAVAADRPGAARPARLPIVGRVRALGADPLLGWLGPLAVAVLAGWLRFDRLRLPKALVFDEVYYAKDAHAMLHHGVELTAQGGAEFVVHPPLGKWLIAIGEWIFGYNSLGWRVAAAFVGTLTVLVLARTARRLTGSTLLGCLAGLLLALDGLHFVLSRVALLDVFLTFWVVLAFHCIVADRAAGRRRLAADGRLGIRWWRVAAGFCLGAACATKWSGAYELFAFPLLALAWDVGARRTSGSDRPWRAMLRRDLPRTVLSLGVLPLAVYVASWTGWFATGTGWDRHWAADHPSAAWGWIPGVLRGWWHYHWEIWNFHTHLTASHPYQSNPVGWLLLARPVSFYYSSPKQGDLGCHVASCSREILGIGTPAIWWASIPALLLVLGLWWARRDWRAAGVLVGFASGYLPWIATIVTQALEGGKERTMFLFYLAPSLPFMVLALVLVAGWILGGPQASPARRTVGSVAVGGYTMLVVINFFYLYPILAAQVIPYDSWHARMWFGSWI